MVLWIGIGIVKIGEHLVATAKKAALKATAKAALKALALQKSKPKY